ncbi:PD-(D/E)XK nuclease family protein [Anaerotardibacter muris]|uniref:PD-(D/E)XK nuclease family protein n=1 Tax=Anaerotardibacter muris TaxID=2941505 RepID=UPI00203DA617|nr:PD-(D/E)XK nuclease family protein [Anaerotardibacter muris]
MITETVILFSTQEEALRYRKKCALSCGDALLGVTATTPESLIEELWDVWGTRERIVSAAQRTMIVNALLEQQDTWVRSAGTVSLLRPFLHEAIGYITPEFCKAHEDDLTPIDQEIVQFTCSYESTLAEAGLIESSQALNKIVSFVSLEQVVVRTMKPLPVYFSAFLRQVSSSYTEESPQLMNTEHRTGSDTNSLEMETQLPADRRYSLLNPKGETAAAQMVFQSIQSMDLNSKILVSAPDPFDLFLELKDALIDQDFAVSLRSCRPFSVTFFGQAFDAIAQLVYRGQDLSREAILRAAATYIESPYAQIMEAQRSRLLRAIRADRSLGAFEVHAALQHASSSFEYFEALMQDSDADILLGYFEDMVHRLGLSGAEISCELAALSRVKSLYREARKLGQEPYSFFDLIDSLSVPFQWALEPDRRSDTRKTCDQNLTPFAEVSCNGESRVLFTTLEDAASYPEGCCDLVVLTSLDSAHYSGAQRVSTLTDFARRFDIPFTNTRLIDMERMFARAVRTSRDQVVFQFAEQDLSGDEYFPAFFLESFLNERELQKNKIAGVPLGEDAFDSTARIIPLVESDIVYEGQAERGNLSVSELEDLVPFTPDSQGVLRPVVSPSGLELYLKCPYRWFVQRKLHLEDEGEEFGPREAGLFAHSVLQSFYDQWAQKGYQRIDPENIDEALAFFSEVFDSVADAQIEAQPGDRYLPTGELEREELAHLKRQLEDSLSYQQHMFPGYSVSAHEEAIRKEDTVVYGGAIIHGRIDRIDQDESGNFLVIDYKGSTTDHEAGFTPLEEGETFELPDKVQALIYAQALRRKGDDLHPKAALYLSYRAKEPKQVLKGSILETLPESDMYTEKSNVVHGDMEAYLDQVEDGLAEVISRMVTGDITPDPRNSKACSYCPVLYCEKRVDGSK